MKENWNLQLQQRVRMPANVHNFLIKLDALCHAHNISISHEDEHGAFILKPYSEKNRVWLEDAMLDFPHDFDLLDIV